MAAVDILRRCGVNTVMQILLLVCCVVITRYHLGGCSIRVFNFRVTVLFESINALSIDFQEMQFHILEYWSNLLA